MDIWPTQYIEELCDPGPCSNSGGCLHSLAQGPHFHLQSQHISSNRSLSDSVTNVCFPIPHIKVCYDCIGPIWIITS